MTAAGPEPAPLVVRVLPDVPAIDKRFDYVVPEPLRDHVRAGTMVRIDLHGRRVGGWVVEVGVEPPPGVEPRPIAKVTGHGPPADVLALAGWAAWRWAGRAASFLRTASPPAAVRRLPPPPAPPAPPASPASPGSPGSPGSLGSPDATGSLGSLGSPAAPGSPEATGDAVADALGRDRAVLRLGPAADRYGVVRAAVARAEAHGGWALVVCPGVGEAQRLAARLRREGFAIASMSADLPPAVVAGEWAAGAAGAHVVGARSAAWAPVANLRHVVVLDEHDEGLQSEQSPTWHARDVAVERAARAGAHCTLVSPCPTLEALAWGPLVAASRAHERAAWPMVEVVDRRDEDPVAAGLYSDAFVRALRAEGRVVCVVNRTGRSRLLACAACGELARCAACEAAVSQPDAGRLVCGRCGADRPVVCLGCGGSRMKNLRAGVSRVREEIEALAGEPVGEITAATAGRPVGGERVVVGTEAALHQVASAAVVAFLDLDQELAALRYRAGEQAFALLARGARLVRGRRDGSRAGRLLVQTRLPTHPAVQAAVHADPGRVVRAEGPVRAALRMPPASAMAVVSGAAAPAFVAALGTPLGVEVQGPAGDAWRVRAADHRTLCDALAAVTRPPGRLRIEVDPLRI